MADLKISELGSLAGADLVAADVVAVVDNSASETKKLTVSDLIANGVTLISDATIPSAKVLFSAGSVNAAALASSAVETAKINDSAVTAGKLADNSSVTLVSTLPGSGDFVGQVALDTDDSKIYVWSGSAWTSVKAAGSINVVSGSTSGLVNITATTSGDTVTISTTLDDTSAARQFLAGPTGSGGTVGYRAIIGTDLPTASSSEKGGVIVNGNGLAMSGDTLTVNNSVTAETTENHLVKYDANGLVTSGRVIASGDVPVATSSTTGSVLPGTGLSVTGSGVLNHSNSLTAATGPKITFDAQGHVTGSTALVATDIPDLDAAKLTTGSLPSARIADDAITADKLADRSTATIAEVTPAGGAFIGQTHLNSITGDYFLWDGNVWQPIGISVGEIVLAGTYNATTNLVATVTTEGTAVGYTVGQALPAASSSNKGHYVIISTAGTGTSPAPTVALSPPDFLLSTGTLYTEIDVSQTVTAQQASNVQFTPTGSIAANNVQTAIAEVDTEKAPKASPTFSGTVSLDTAATIQFEGSSANDFETTLTVTDPTADRTIALPNVSGTLVSTGDTGTVTSAMIADGAIVNADINAGAEIAVNKLANGTARQLLQTDSGGSGVEFTSNVDVPGTLDVTSAATFDSTVAVAGLLSANGKLAYPAGSAAAVSLYSGSDTDTGIYSPGANQFGIATAGTSRIVVDASGNVGVGTTSANVGSFATGLTVATEASNTVSALELIGDRGGDGAISTIAAYNHRSGNNYPLGKIEFTRDGGNDTHGGINIYGYNGTYSGITIDQAGNVGVGTTSPDQMLHLSNSSGPVLRFENTDTTISSGNSFGSIEFESKDSSSSAGVVAKIEGFAPTGMDGSSANGGAIRFSTATVNPVNLTERLRISSSGNATFQESVGIGITPSTSPLEILSGTSNSSLIEASGASAGRGLKISTFANTANDAGVLFDAPHSTYGTLAFGTSGVTALTIDTSQRVGIGTTSTMTDAQLTLGASTEVALGFQRTGSGKFDAGIKVFDGHMTFLNGSDSTTVSGLSERLRIDSSGNVKIVSEHLRFNTSGKGIIFGTDGGSNRPSIIGNYTSSSNNEIAFNVTGSQRMSLDSSGRLLVGTSTARNDFNNGSASCKVQVEGTDFASSSLSATRNSVDAGSPTLELSKTRSASIGGVTVVANNDKLGTINFAGSDGTDLVRSARIEAQVDGTPGANDMPGRLVFSTTADGASSPTERLKIDSSGNLIAYGTVQTDGAFVSQGANAAGYLFQGNNNGSEVSFLKDDGSAKFTGNVTARALVVEHPLTGNTSITTFSNGNDEEVIAFKANGSASFASGIDALGTYSSTANTRQFSINSGGVFIKCTSTDTDTFTALNVVKSPGTGGNATSIASIGGNGSAIFAGQITAVGNDGSSGLTVNTTAAGKGVTVLGATGGDIRLKGNGAATFTGSITASNVSDVRFKENITDANPQLADAVALGSQLKNFDWNDDAPLNEELRARRFLGLVAQEAEKVCPELTYTVPRTKQGKELTPAVLDEEGNETKAATYEELDDSYKAINHEILVMKLLGAVAELSAKVAALEAG